MLFQRAFSLRSTDVRAGAGRGGPWVRKMMEPTLEHRVLTLDFSGERERPSFPREKMVFRIHAGVDLLSTPNKI